MTAQQLDCSFKQPVLKIDFGSAGTATGINIGYLANYRQINGGPCPQDGYYSFASYTSDCFNGEWITMNEDHTPGDDQGRIMIVNASEKAGTFFRYPIQNLMANTTYEISAWIVNICKTSSPCNPTPPSLSFVIQSNTGIQLSKFRTGVITPTNGPKWHRYYCEFTTPPGVTGIILRMDDETNGGCGNDFALDDILLKECMLHKPEIKEPTKPAVSISKKATVPAAKPMVKEPKPVIKVVSPVTPPLKKNIPSLAKEEVKGKPLEVKPLIKGAQVPVPVPEVLVTRSNPVVKKIETAQSEMLVELYDNGEIDGDTVSIYHNNSLVVANAALSEKPISFKISVEESNPHHELVMVANNLGSIPPNTSLMVISANGKRYEVFISSTEQKNARIVIDLKE